MARPGPDFVEEGHASPDLALTQACPQVVQEFARFAENHVGYMVSDPWSNTDDSAPVYRRGIGIPEPFSAVLK